MEHIKPQNAGQYSPEELHEESDINAKGVLGFLAFLAIMAAVIHVVVWGLMIGFDRLEDRYDPQPNPMLQASQTAPKANAQTSEGAPDVQKKIQKLVTTFPEPRLQTDDTRDMDVFRRSEEKMLHSYSKVDASGQTVRIPIERAMELISQRGLPDFGGASSTKVSVGQAMAQPGQDSGKLPATADKSTKK